MEVINKMSSSGFYIRTSDGIEVVDCTHNADLRLSAMNFLEHRHKKHRDKAVKGKLVKGLFYKVTGILAILKRVFHR